MTGHLIHIGFPKTGSNFLRRWFANHPQLAYVEGGIAGFRDVYQISRDSAAPTSGILFRVTSSEALTTPHIYVGGRFIDYDRMRSVSMPAAQAEACDNLAGLFPTAHVLLVTRGFRSALLSGFSQYVRTGGDCDFYALGTSFAQKSDDGGKHYLDYDYLIQLYRKAYGDRLIVMPYELMRDDVDGFTQYLEQRLGLDHYPAPAGRVNESLTPVELSWYPRLTRFVHRLPIGLPLRKRVYKFYVRAAMKNRFRPLIRLLQRWFPTTPVTADLIGADTLNMFRGRAELLRDNPLYAAYAEDYLF